MDKGSGSSIQGSGFRVRIQDLRVYIQGLRAKGLGFRDESFRGQDSGFEVYKVLNRFYPTTTATKEKPTCDMRAKDFLRGEAHSPGSGLPIP
jgi:hypothetical protein